jgi:hypothetical protein
MKYDKAQAGSGKCSCAADVSAGKPRAVAKDNAKVEVKASRPQAVPKAIMPSK